MNHLIDKIRASGITPELIADIIEAHKSDHDRMKNLYDRYKAEVQGVPILTREAIEYEDFETGHVKRIDHKVNNKLNNSFDSDIVDTKAGYLFGHPITYEFDDKRETGTTSSGKQMIDDFNTLNNIADEDSEWGKMATICGYGARLAYIDRNGNERVKNIEPWEAVFLSDGNIHEPEYALRYYETYNGQKKAEFYDSKTIYYFSTKDSSAFTLDDKTPHMFDGCPLFGLANNKELKGDAEKVLSLIDAYDRTLSDASNEIEQYRLAYLILKGLGADEDTLQQLKKTGVLELYDEKDDVSYLTKDINDAIIENHLNRLEDNILRFAKSVNFSDESFGGNVTGVAMKFKLMALENKCITMERKMTAALRYQYKLIFSAWATKNKAKAEDYLKVWFGFKRNLPANVLEEAQTTAQLKGMVSEETRLSLLSFVDDVQYELKKMEEEEEEYRLNMPPLTDVETDAGGDEDEPE
ncbi:MULTISPECIES: phage portal protein [Bacillus amyloliquefaciens group]|uniref:phage portal protein n=1 Tax=Bacillus TaxID=1386 RepID=UPI00024167FA|nr:MULTISPECIES: phage portal protein [Bacillus amyloliquefaciens group]AGF28228.1 phage Portal protein [Bacillus amyloliquefaciens IT-45]AMP34062.1 phage portal protein [Bacillus amyloliquefaciens]MBH5316009.1 phage portal protein [Bacillus velezensis]MDQ1915312.1 phage portal protein [Bacillus velezensis]MEC3772203.1 phage portal protein [Bacillus velezensis]